ncbi:MULTISPECIES: hypothetical protein [Dorea]|uniref:hypothetical protein n=1 Tax=Dorea TaxID=189330 RepID=UPI000C77A567|nr:hypothetical protein [Dorea phocaeensis]
MDFTVTDTLGREKGPLEHCGAEFVIGTDNDFEIKIQEKLFKDDRNRKNCRVFAEGTEYGGLIRALNPVTEDKIIKLKGPTWRGILNQRAINPGSNTYITLKGEANAVIQENLAKLGLTEIFSASNENSGIVLNYRVPLQSMLLDAFNAALEDQNARLEIKYKLGDANDKGYVELSAKPIVDHSEQIEISEDGNVKLNILDYQNGVNHLICYGKGEEAARQRVDLYAWPDGSIQKKQYYTGIDLIEQYYENTTPDTVQELEEEAREKFLDLMNYKQLKISVSDMDLELGDIVGGRERITGIYMAEPVVRKIVTVTGKGRVTIDYKLKGET